MKIVLIFPRTDPLRGTKSKNYMVPLTPNTGLYNRLQAQGRIFDHNWAHYDTTRVVFEPAQMTIKELEEGLTHAYDTFYTMGSILKRALRPGPGALRRLALNLVYKRIEPVWKTLDLGVSAWWIRPMTYWYMSASRFR